MEVAVGGSGTGVGVFGIAGVAFDKDVGVAVLGGIDVAVGENVDVFVGVSVGRVSLTIESTSGSSVMAETTGGLSPSK